MKKYTQQDLIDPIFSHMLVKTQPTNVITLLLNEEIKKANMRFDKVIQSNNQKHKQELKKKNQEIKVLKEKKRDISNKNLFLVTETAKHKNIENKLFKNINIFKFKTKDLKTKNIELKTKNTDLTITLYWTSTFFIIQLFTTLFIL